MPKIKWSAFPNVGTNVTGDTVVGLRAGTNVEFNPITPQELQTNAFNFAVDTGVADAYVANLTPAVAVLTAGLTLFVKITNANTGASTLTVNGLTAPIVTTHNVALTAGLLIANQAAVFVYSTTLNAFILINPAIIPVISGGTGNNSVGANGTLAQSDGSKYTFTTATYPSTTAINKVLYSSANNVVDQISSAVGGVMVTNATSVPSMLANPADNYRVLMSQNVDIPVWSTSAYPRTADGSGTIIQSNGTDYRNTQATYPYSTNKNHILYSSANNTVGELGTQKAAVLVSDNSNTPQWSGSLTDGQIIIGKTNDLPAAASLTAGTGISITPGANSITITNTAPATGSGTVNSGLINQLAWYAANGTAVSGLSTANNGVLITSAGGVPSISSTLPTSVQGNITSVGTIASGTWNGGIIGSSYGGTGVNNGSSTITLGGSLTTSGAFASTFTMTNTTNVTFPTSGTLATTAQLPTPAALTSVSDTNVTITLGGTPATALLQASSITMGWSGQLSVARGGTGTNTIGANGTLAQSNGTIYTFTTATYPSIATGTGTILRANGTNWLASTATFADTYSASSLLYSNGSNTVTGLATANSATLVTNSTGVPAWTASMTDGQVLIGATGGTPTPATLTAGANITITNAANSITIASTGGGTTWTEVTGTSQAMAVNSGYIANNAGLVTLTLPGTAAVGSIFYVQGKGAGGWKIAQNAGQSINFGSVATTAGVGGSLASSLQYDSICLVCITANTTFAVLGSPQGNITYV